MKKRVALVGTILSLIPFGQPLMIKTGLFLSTTGLILTVPKNLYAKDNSFYFNRAFEKGENGDHYGAISDYNKALEIDSNDIQAYFNRGWNKGKLKDHYGAISDYIKALELDPQYADAYVNRGIEKELIEDIKGACADWRKASDLGVEDAANWVRDQC